MKTLFRFVSCSLPILMLFSLSGCENANSDATAGTLSDGKTLTVVTTVSGSDGFRPDAGISPRTDRILEAILAAEAEGYTVTVQTVSENDLSDSLMRTDRSGTKYADLIQSNALLLSKHYAAGRLISLADAGIEPSETGALKTPDGIAYAFRADGWCNPIPTASYTVLYNEEIFWINGCETPMELYESGAWNWVNFEKLCRQISSTGSGVRAFAEPTETEPDLIWATLHAAGAVYFDADGVCVMDSQAALDGFSALRRLLTSGCTYATGSYVNDGAEPTAVDAFVRGRTAFYVGNSSVYFDTGEDSVSSLLGEKVRMLGFPAIAPNVSGTAFSAKDVFFGVSSFADKTLCQTLLPKLFSLSEEDPKTEISETRFFYEEDAKIYFDLLSSADTDSSLWMTDNRSMVENFFVQVSQGGSAKEILDNLEMIFNSPKKG